jgi:methionyl-tRNA synthetase
MLMAAGLPVPRKVFAHGWLLVGGEKMSKSKLTGISPADITSHFGVDAFRYYFMRAIPFGNDGSFSWEDMSARYTSELANDFGNLASRLLAMLEKYCDGKIPEKSEAETLAKSLTKTVSVADEAICALDFQTGINAIMDYCKEVNGYVTTNEPWVVAKDPSRKKELDAILYNTAESLRALAVLLFPVMPISTKKLWNSLGAESSLGPIEKHFIAQASNWGQLKPGTKTSKGEILFPRLEETEK